MIRKDQVQKLTGRFSVYLHTLLCWSDSFGIVHALLPRYIFPLFQRCWNGEPSKREQNWLQGAKYINYCKIKKATFNDFKKKVLYSSSSGMWGSTNKPPWKDFFQIRFFFKWRPTEATNHNGRGSYQNIIVHVKTNIKLKIKCFWKLFHLNFINSFCNPENFFSFCGKNYHRVHETSHWNQKIINLAQIAWVRIEDQILESKKYLNVLILHQKTSQTKNVPFLSQFHERHIQPQRFCEALVWM